MKFICCAAVLAAGLIVAGCHRDASSDALKHHHHHDEAEEAAEHAGHDHDHGAGEASDEPEGVIHLSDKMADRLGVKTGNVSDGDFTTAVKVAGVIEPGAASAGAASAPTAGIVTLASGIAPGAEVRAGQLIATVRADAVTGGDPNRAARADLQAAKAELDRIKPLWEERLVTRAQYNQAVADYERARAAFSAPAASGRVTAPVSGVISSLAARTGQFVETGAVIAEINGSGSMILRAEVPAAQYGSLGTVTDARVVLPYSGESFLISESGGRRTGASAAGARAGYVPVTFSFSAPGAMPGTAVEVYLLGTTSRKALTVPVSAIVEQQGDYYVYLKVGEDIYLKQPVTLGAADGSRREVLSGLHGGETIVTEGTTAVTLAAAAGNVPEGHSHQH